MDFSGSLGGTDELWADGGLDGGANRHHSSVHASEEVFVRASRRSVFRASRRSLLVAPMRSLFMPPRRSLFVPPRRSVFRASEEVCVSCLRGGLCFVPPRRSLFEHPGMPVFLSAGPVGSCPRYRATGAASGFSAGPVGSCCAPACHSVRLLLQAGAEGCGARTPPCRWS